MTPSRPRRAVATAPSLANGLTRRGFLTIALVAGTTGAWAAAPATAAPSITAAHPAAVPAGPERPHRTLLGVL